MTTWKRSGVSLAAIGFGILALTLAGCASGRVATRNISSPEPIQPLPSSQVASTNLPAIGQSGAIAPNLLRIMARLAEHTPYGVTTLSQGHPYEVFGTDKQSDHTRGRAVDIYRLGDTLVIDDRAEGSMTYKTVQWLYDQPGIRQIGSPWALDGYGGKSFSDRLHQDHLHIAANP